VNRGPVLQVTQCYKLRTARTSARSRASNTLLLALLVSVGVTASVGCGGESVAATTTRLPASTLPGWRAVDDPPGIAQLAPNLHELLVVAQVDREALVKKGDAIRSTTFTFATPKEAVDAQKRGAGDNYQGDIERALRGDTVARGPGIGLRLRVPRPTGSGSDSVEVYLLARGRRLTVVELLSARGFDPSLRDRILARLSR
jgi:hypothetical protein